MDLREGSAGVLLPPFYDFEPDLNMANPSVRAEVQRIIGYWLELGVAGFRVDAVPFILEKPAPQGGKPKLEFGYLKEMRDFLQWRAGNAVLLRRGERGARRVAEVLRRRRRAAHDVRLLGQPAPLPLARDR